MVTYDTVQETLRAKPKSWLITGVAGFIGSHLLEKLLKLDQQVFGLDNFSNGKRRNLEEVGENVKPEQWARFHMLEGDVANLNTCEQCCRNVQIVLHQAALGSVPRSIEDPVAFHQSNVTGTFNLLFAAQKSGMQRFVYASSSSVYGDEPTLPKVEELIGTPLSPYAASKAICETYAHAFAETYRLESIGLRYFNVFGPRQDPEGAYAAVIPKWITTLLHREPVHIHGDGETSRDFCYVENVVQANLIAATTTNPTALNECYNIALGERTTLTQLFHLLRDALRRRDPSLPAQKPIYGEFRPGDIKHSLADIHKAQRLLGYQPTHQIDQGLELAMDWYCRELA